MAKSGNWFEVLVERVRDSAIPAENSSGGRRHWIAVFTALCLSVGLWFTLSMRETYPEIVELKLSVDNLPAGKTLQAPLPDVVRMQVEGEGWQLLQLIQQPPEIRIDARNVTESEEIDLQALIPVRQLPDGVRIESVSPTRVRLALDPKVSRRIPVSINGKLTPAGTYDFLTKPRTYPDSVTISGPERIVSALESWPTQRLSKATLSRSFTERILLSDTLSSIIEIERENVMLRVAVEQFTEGRQQVRVTTRTLPREFRQVVYSPAFVDVIFRVPVSRYDSVAVGSFQAVVDWADIAADSTGWVQPRIMTPAGIVLKNVRSSPRRVAYVLALSR